MDTGANLQEVETHLEDLTEQAYQVFGKYRVKQLRDVCTVCCISKEEENHLLAVSAGGLSCEDLSTYATAAFATQPDAPDEFRHFLPRYLELLKDFETPGAVTETTLNRLKQYRAVKEWPEAEIQLLDEFASSLFTKALLSYPVYTMSPITLLIIFDNGGIDINPLLVQWQNTLCDTRLFHLKDLLLEGLNAKKDYQLSNGFASDTLSHEFHQWLTDNSPALCTCIEQFIADSTEPDDMQLEELSWVYEILMHHFNVTGSK